METLLLERALIAAAALALSLPFGIIFARVTGITWLSRAVHRSLSKITARLNRHEREAYTIAMRGVFVVVALLLGAWVVGNIVNALILPAHHQVSLASVLLLTTLLNAGAIIYPLFMMARAAKKHAWPKVDDYLKMLAPASHAADGHGKLRLAIVIATSHMQHRILGSLAAFILAGFAGLLTYRALYVFVLHAPVQLPNWRAFGLIANWLFTPLRMITHIVLVLLGTFAGACVPGCKPFAALIHAGTLHAYIASMLHISLGGAATRYGKSFDEVWRGFGTAKIDAPHARRASIWLGLIIALIMLCMAGLSILHS